ncbi:unnamed protein product [Bursaphelenchus okinawaensis]|uniref:NADP-dependent oxidoreductase domain-containing protein n=1 Tax=Bursaphelenchus okinawaensis TaxID=465554 RepID=A0A811L409_9BILA|nr:unnamed protein product [Bursaphelenchus okinawaensis]CAG9115681.1 unnamed protein product [Bursaphelenchus okinawaensis]
MSVYTTPHYTFNNGVKQPVLGLGTWQAQNIDELRNALRTAINIGYRYLDTAYGYGNEAQIGQCLEELFNEGVVKREELFIATKLPFHKHKPEDTKATIKEQLKNLRLDYIDLYLIHNACGVKTSPEGGFLKDANGLNVPELTPHVETWKVLEKFYAENKLRAIGVSNFRCDQLEQLYNEASIKPANLQIELHIYHRQRKLLDLCKKLNIAVTSYASLGSPARKQGFGPGDYPDADCLGNEIVKELAKKYKKTPGQILLRHLLQLGVSVIPKSTNPERLKQNFDVFDFELEPEDFEKFDEIKEDVRLFSFSFAKGHPWYPPFEA